MKKLFRFTLVLLSVGLLAACGSAATLKPVGPTAIPIATQTLPPAATPTTAPSVAPTSAPIIAPTTAPSVAPTSAPIVAPTSAPTIAPVASIPSQTNLEASVYIDDRSNAVSVIRSMFNAINRHEYVRAYGYWSDTSQRPSFDQFQNGYQNTASVQVTLGAQGESVGAGQYNYSLPVLLSALTNDGSAQTFVGCYLLHLSSPGAQGTLPFAPLAIQSADVQAIDAGANVNNRLAHACDAADSAHGFSPSGLPQATPAPDDISTDRYLDDRSDAVQLMRSFFNSINLHEYIRTYSYWSNTSQLPNLNDFQNGYANTQSVDLTIGTVNSQGTAGSFYYQVPMLLAVHSADGTTQNFAGCYTLRQPDPGIQGIPPFNPTGIDSANVQQLAAGADAAQALSQACPAQ